MIKRCFHGLNLSKEVANAASKLYKTPTPVQKLAIPKLANKENIIMNAETGSGKTMAYLLPLISNLSPQKSRHNKDSPSILILVPSKHLQMQTMLILDKLSKTLENSLSFSVFPAPIGIPSTQRNSIQIAVGVPGQILHFYKKHTLLEKSFENLEMLCIDECDFILSDAAGLELFKKIQNILKKRNIQYCFAGATLPAIKDEGHKTARSIIANEFKKKQLSVLETPEIHATRPGLEESFIRVFGDKLGVLSDLIDDLNKGEQCIIFCENQQSTKLVYESIKSRNELVVDLINDETGRELRAKTLLQISNEKPNEKAHVIVSTDMISRGVDFQHVTRIINYDFPKFAKDYLHRVGRTCRGENLNGKSVSLVSEGDLKLAEMIESCTNGSHGRFERLAAHEVLFGKSESKHYPMTGILSDKVIK